ncbi:unnamed protein product [Rangifer tarandus platyrhynchus]|uniref:Uncharacterized protein n=1 Tax=Rangifer tarandus platyrhynchus TaxID=3082113 RepID=A0AC60A1V8_RANTA
MAPGALAEGEKRGRVWMRVWAAPPAPDRLSHEQFQFCLIKERKEGLLGGSVHISVKTCDRSSEQPSSPSMWSAITQPVSTRSGLLVSKGNYLSSEFPVLQPPPPTEMCVQDRSLGRGRVSCGLPAPGLPAFPGLGGRSASLALRRVRARSAGSSWKAREATLPPVSGAERLLKPRCRQGRGNHGAVGTGRPGLRRLR